MTLLLLPLLAFFLSLGLALYFGPVVIRAAIEYGIVDKPNTPLKTHEQPVAYLGGLVIFLPLLTTLALALPFEQQTLAVLLAASLVVSVGLIDDLGAMKPREKMFGQTVAALVLVKAGLYIEIATVPTLGAQGLTVFWLLVCMNATNIVDVSDGLAATSGMVGGGIVTVLAVLQGELPLILLGATLVGSCGGFWWFNKQPARIYLGDTGSMLLGCLLGTSCILSSFGENVFAPMFVPFTIMAIPFFDLALVIIARLLAKRPITQGSPDHFAVRMRDAGISPSRITGIAAFFGVVFGALGLTATQVTESTALVVSLCGLAFGVLLIIAVFVRFPSRESPRFTPPSS